MDTEATGPEQIRAAFHTAIEAATGQSAEIVAIAGVLGEAADQYEARRMRASTVACLREAAAAVTTAGAGLAAAGQALQAAFADFNARDGAVADAVADAGGNLAATPILNGTGEAAMTNSHQGAAPAPPAGHPLPDVLGAVDEDICFASDVVPGLGPAAAELRLMDYDGHKDEPGWGDGGVYVELAPSHERGDVYAAPNLSPDEAEQVAADLDALADQAEAGYTPAKPNKYGRSAQRVRQLLTAGHLEAGEKVTLLDDDTLSITYKDLVKLLSEADPATTTSRTVRAKANEDNGGEAGMVVMDLKATPGGTQVTVLPMEGTTSDWDDEFWDKYRTHLTPSQARELASKLRTFVGAVRGLHHR